MSRYIDAELLEPDTEWDDYEDGYISYSDHQIRCAKTADVRENVRGEWIDDREHNCYLCSACGLPGLKSFGFCPNCGADMRGGDAE